MAASAEGVISIGSFPRDHLAHAVAAEDEPARQSEPRGVFRELAANIDHPCPAAAIEAYGAKRHLHASLKLQGTQKNGRGKKEKHARDNERGASQGDIGEKQQTANDLEPRQPGRNSIQRPRRGEELVFAQELEEIYRVSGFTQTHVDKHGCQQPARKKVPEAKCTKGRAGDEMRGSHCLKSWNF